MLSWAAGSSLLVIASLAHAQQAPGPQTVQAKPVDDSMIEEVIVSARRRDESLQDVPQTVNAVTGASLEKLSITKFEDIQAVVPGVTLSSGNTGFSSGASMRGATYAIETGASPTVDFYLNDTLTSSFFLFQSTFDLGQLEVLRGPQGTLRGRASPSGSITVTTRRPDLQSFGGYVSAVASDQRSSNIQGAVNLPIVKDKLGLRIAAVYDNSDYDQVHSINSSLNPFSTSKGGRLSLLATPTDNVSASLVYQHLERRQRSFDAVQSLSEVDPSAAASPVLIRASDRLGITDGSRMLQTQQDMLIGQVNLRFGNQALTYVGSFQKAALDAATPLDGGNRFPGFEYYQNLESPSENTVHEVRLSSVERLWGMIDYTAGVFRTTVDGRSNVTVRTPVTLFGNVITVVQTPITTQGVSKETSAFANLTAHLGEKTELAGGLRVIHAEGESKLSLSGATLLTTARDDTPTIYNVSISHRFSDNVLAYANTGSSWRQGPFMTGVFRPLTPRLQKYIDLKPEKSVSYEAGVKAMLFDRRLRLNLAAFHQKFDGFIYRGTLTPYINLNNSGENVDKFNFGANVDAVIDGVDVDFTYQPSRQFSLTGGVSYAHGRIKNGTVACQDLDQDGKIDTGSTTPTLAQLQASTGGQGVAECRLNGRLSTSPDWSATLQPEASFKVGEDMDAFVRGLLTYYPKNPQDPFNKYDSVGAYGLVNLYAGVRDARGAWELSLFVKNATNTGEVLNSGPSALATTYQALQPPTFQSTVGTTFNSSYLTTRYTPPREVGISLRYAFGSR
jgi:iron complex outermembrane receptor protein